MGVNTAKQHKQEHICSASTVQSLTQHTNTVPHGLADTNYILLT